MRRSTEISALRTREKKAWAIIDQHLRTDLNVPAKVKQAAAEFILKRIYPERLLVGGEVKHTHKVEMTEEEYNKRVKRLLTYVDGRN